MEEEEQEEEEEEEGRGEVKGARGADRAHFSCTAAGQRLGLMTDAS